MKAIVFGARTPLGRALVERILKKETFDHVEAVVDQDIPSAEFGDVFSGIEDASLFDKLHIRVVAYDQIKDLELEADVFDYCGIALSTSESSESSSESSDEKQEEQALAHFHADYASDAAKVAERANIPSISMVSSQGVDSSSFYSFLSTKNEPNKKEMRFEKTVIHHGPVDDDIRWSDMDFWHDRISAPFPHRWGDGSFFHSRSLQDMEEEMREREKETFHMSSLADSMVNDFMDFRKHMLLGGRHGRKALDMSEENEEEN
jgi:hypothetical protein